MTDFIVAKDFSFLSCNIRLISSQFMSASIQALSVLIILLPIWNDDNKDWIRVVPRVSFEKTKKFLLNKIENTHAWKESVTINDAS